MAEFTVCSSNALVIDQSILWGWLLGLSVDQMVGYRQPRTQTPVSNKVLKSYVLTQYRNFELLEHCLHEPRYFYEQQYLFPLSPQAKKLLVERYYGFDEPVMRELLGKKLSARARKDLDEVSEKTKIHLGSCRRQFDNLKWILKQVEDSENRPIIEEIQNYFMLSKDHASKYAHIIFITNNRLDTSKRKLAHFTFEDFEYCGAVFMSLWTSSTTATLPEFDTAMASDLRDLKAILLNEKTMFESYRTLVTQQAQRTVPTATLECLQMQFKTILRNVLTIGSGLSSSKEVRDLFIDLVEKVCEPLTGTGCSAAEVGVLFDTMIEQFANVVGMTQMRHLKRYEGSLERLLKGVKLAGMKLYRVFGHTRTLSKNLAIVIGAGQS